MRGVSKENAFEAVAGYVVANDVSARDLQFARRPVDARQVARHVLPGRPARAGRRRRRSRTRSGIRAILNGDTVQDSTTANLIFGIDEIVSYVSQTSTLEAGDLILTGTPAGVGVFRDPQRLLQPGDEITIEIDGVGSLTNPVVRGLMRTAAVADSRRRDA